ncbi:class I SAM-dependent methyltransferase [Streptomyces boncukensis]|uniref:Methyltransferase domain-containing protein n=1 Tax=Streptomyces boncukensis TaxID=2711219 RepID=A0A6G4WYV9_9ACTN|nr:class I SAM-dependent methyltransferase [Streptomyces boncukensis]NGO69797.1 methyltransferase domain-containing protein [Streptomyces boncukensis]
MPALDSPTSDAAAAAAELERVLHTHPGVARAVVRTQVRPDGTPVRTAYVVPCRNDAVQDDAAALGRQYVAEWQGVYDHVYAQPASEDPTFDTRGWLSSYTGGELGEEDMRAWLDATVTRIEGLGARRVLEVGCGTGMLLHRLAPGTERYLASDISAGAVERIRDSFGGALPAGVEVFQAPADDLSAVAPGAVDGFVVNSVSQYFPDEEYLDRLVRQAVDVVGEGGFLFVGDVRSAAVNRAFSAGLELARAPERAPSEKVQGLAERRCCTGTELLVDPGYFTALPGRLPRVAHVAVLLRRGARRTEMNRFRYDVVIRLDRLPGGEAVVPEWQPWDRRRWSADALRRHLAEERPAVLGLLGVPNARVLADHAAAELLSRPDRPAVAAEVLARARESAGDGLEPEDFWALGDDLPYAVRLSWARSLPDGAFDLSLVRVEDGAGKPAPEVRFPDEPAPPRRPVNRPWYGRVENLSPAKLRAHVRARGAEAVMPGRFVLLESLPGAPGQPPDEAALRAIQWA